MGRIDIRQIGMAQLIAAILIKFVTLTPQTTIFRIVADNLDDTFETAEKRHAFAVQADQ